MTLSSQLRAVALIAVLGALLFGCGDTGKDGGPGGTDLYAAPPDSVDGTTYVVTGVTDKGRPRALVPGSEIRVAFGDDQVRITAGCNSMSGAYRLQGARLEVESLATTEMGCEQALMEQDTWVAGLFTGPVQLTGGNDAAIISGDVVLSLADREAASPDKPLVGTTWVLDSIGAAGADGSVSSVPQGAEARVRLNADGTVDVFDGCNGGSGRATVDGSTITWGERGQTKKACFGAADEVASAVAAILVGRTSFEVEELTLTVTKDDGYLGFRAG